MRTVMIGMNLSIDGTADHDKLSGDDELVEYFNEMMKDVDYGIYGRKMYDIMVPYWAEVAKKQSGTDAGNEFANKLVGGNRVVFSRSLTSLPDGTPVINGSLRDEIERLKQLPGKKISIAGVRIRSEAMALDLVDEFYFVIHPALVGAGVKLFDNIALPETIHLKLIECRVLKSGKVGLHYVRDREEAKAER